VARESLSRHARRERFAFRHFFDVLAGGGALAEWGLGCWLAGYAAPWPLHVIGPALLAVVNRLAARRYESELPAGILTGRTGAVALGTAFGALVAAVVVVVLAGAWAAMCAIGALRAEAGMTGRLVVEPIFGIEFRWIGAIATAMAGVAVAYGYAVGYRRLSVTALAVPIPGLRPPFAGLRVVHVSDLHLGPLADRAALRDAIERVGALDPDLVCVTGDLVDSDATDLDSWIPELARLTARHGVFAILGNHDHRVGADRVAAAVLRWTAWRLLRDEIATLEADGARLHVVGFEDRAPNEAADVLPGLLACVPKNEPAILLAHRPSVFDAAIDADLPLVLAGHTHGGQIAVPGAPRLNPARLLLTPYDAGTFRRRRTVLHVNRGLGTSGQRVRIGAPREITVVTLVAPKRALTPSQSHD